MNDHIARDLTNKIVSDLDKLIKRTLALVDDEATMISILTALHNHVYEWLATAHIELKLVHQPPMTSTQRKQFAEFIADQVTKDFKEKYHGPDRSIKISR